MASIYLIRHGQASLGMADYDELSELGIRQSKLLGKELLQRNISFDKIICGTMKRHNQTAEGCLSEMDLKPEMINDASWNEFDHMDIIAKYEPRYSDVREIINDISGADNPKQKIMDTLQAAFTRWIDGKNEDYNESWNAYQIRVKEGLSKLKEQSGKKEKVLVFTSGGPICSILGIILKLSPQKIIELQASVANASITQLRLSELSFNLVTFNDHAHFTSENKKFLSFR